MTHDGLRRHATAVLLIFSMIVVIGIYWPGLSGSWLFDDYPNIVDNHGVQPSDASIPSLVRAALSSPSSEFKRPLASLSFAANYLASGLNPCTWKVTNLLIHLLNGLLVFVLAQGLLQVARRAPVGAASAAMLLDDTPDRSSTYPQAVHEGIAAEAAPTNPMSDGIVATLIAAGWMLLPINLTAVLYVVQRMESMANLFVLLGLIGYVAGRRRMLGMARPIASGDDEPALWTTRRPSGFLLCLLSITVPTAVGIMAKETAVMLPLYAVLIEWLVFGFQRPASASTSTPATRRDRSILALFMLVLVLPMIVGLACLVPGVLNPEAWATRDFTLATRLLSEARIIVDYVVWTLLPTPGALSFYHDDFHVSSGLLSPWTTLASIALLGLLIALMLRLRRRQPLAALGIALFLSCQLLTGTILPLELIYEHRNYFASFGLLLAIVPLLAAPSRAIAYVGAHSVRDALGIIRTRVSRTECVPTGPHPSASSYGMALPRYVLLAGLMLYWMTLTALTAYAWGDPLRLAQVLADRAPQSPRAQYELGRTYIIYSHYDPTSPFTALAYAPLEKAADLPNSSILPQQALIFMNSRMGLPLKDAWWDSMTAKLKSHTPGVQDESSLSALTQCAREQRCNLPARRMVAAFDSALAHPDPSSRLLATYGDYAWNVLDNRELGLKMMAAAATASPNEPAYQITLIHMLIARHQPGRAKDVMRALQRLNVGGRLDRELATLQASFGEATSN